MVVAVLMALVLVREPIQNLQTYLSPLELLLIYQLARLEQPIVLGEIPILILRQHHSPHLGKPAGQRLEQVEMGRRLERAGQPHLGMLPGPVQQNIRVEVGKLFLQVTQQGAVVRAVQTVMVPMAEHLLDSLPDQEAVEAVEAQRARQPLRHILEGQGVTIILVQEVALEALQ